MSKKNFSNRLETLFSNAAVPDPEPAVTPEPAINPEAAVNPEAETALESEDVVVGKQQAAGGWETYLDGIHKAKQIGFAYDQGQVRALEREEIEARDSEAALKEMIEVGGDLIGSIALENGGAREWQPEEQELVQKVALRLSQQIESLRLLEQSQRFQREAEVAFQRLTRGNWEQYIQDSDEEKLAYTYDLNQVRTLNGSESRKSGKAAELDLKVRDHLIGKLVIDAPEGMDSATRKWVQKIGERLSAHLDGLRLNEQREQALVESELLYEISAHLSTSSSLQAVLDAMAQPAIAAKADHTQLYLIEKDREGKPIGLKVAAVWGRVGVKLPLPVGYRFNLAELPSYTSWLSDPENPLISVELSEDERLDENTKAVFARDGIQSAALLPLAIGREWIGIALFNWNEPHTFGEIEKRLYKALSGQAAVVLNNIILLEQTRTRAREMETVARVSTAASSTLSPDELLQTVVDLTRENFDLYYAQIYLMDEQSGRLRIGAGTGEVGRKILEEVQEIDLRDEENMAARAARRRELIIENDVKAEENYAGHPLLPDTRSQMVIPMIVGEDVLGVMDVQSAEANRFTEEDKRTYATLAAQTAVALQNANLYVEQAETVERLRELDHLKSNFLANMSHELRTPLNSIQGFTDVMLLGIDGELTEQMRDDLTLIQKNGKHLLELINAVLDMAKIESGRMRLGIEKFELREVLAEAMELASVLAREKGIALDLEVEEEQPLEIWADRMRLKQVLINLLGNGVKFTEKGRVCVRAGKGEEEVWIKVEDTGLGIPADKLEMIFESFSQVDTSTTRKAGGTGLGLPISRSLVEMHGGRLWAESAGIPGQGSTFIIELPIKAADLSYNQN